jgi:hypothetical protein
VVSPPASTHTGGFNGFSEARASLAMAV